jgi:non-heme Fe2+,alpha-ketoglutarate-dependent halogenase
LVKYLTQSQIASFESEGFLSPIDIFSVEQAAELRGRLEEAEVQYPQAFIGSARNNAHLNIKCLDEIVHDSRLLDAVEDLVGPNILNYGTVLFIKEPHDPGFVSWHQDGRYMGLRPYIGATAWVALSEANEQNGCMKMIPGSHREEMHAHSDTFGKDNILTRGQEVDGVDESKAVSTPLKPGQVSFHCPTIIHGSLPNISDNRRIGFSIQSYIPPSVRQIIKRTHAQVVRGTDTEGHFDLAARPTKNMEPAQERLRDQVNATWSDILYAGAEQRRDF